MRIHFDGVNFSSQSGPNTFATRLAKCFIESGHELCDNGNDAEISLVFIEPSGRQLAKKVVQRLDGIWFKPEEFHTKNVNIKALYHAADGVVWQSEFDKQMTIKWFDNPKRGVGKVIKNGIQATKFEYITIPELARIRSTHEQVFVCSSNWHAQKRLKSNIMLFDHIRKTQYPNSCLFVLGSNPDVVTFDPRVMYTGPQPPEVYLQIFAAADWMFHLAWLDHCPNVVIESLSQHTPVVCTNSGGTKELVQDFGLIINEDEYNYELVNYDSPPSVDLTNVRLPDKSTLGNHADIDIKNVANQYLDMFTSILT